jgi:hypothetical protein
LVPKNLDEVRERNAEENEWLKVVPKTNHLMSASEVGRTFDQTVNVAEKNLVKIGVKDTNENISDVHALFVCNREALFPKHFLDKYNAYEGVQFICTRSEEENAGVFKPYIESRKEYHPDFDLVTFTSSPNFRDIRHLLADEEFKHSSRVVMLSRRNGELMRRDTMYSWQELVSTSAASAPGSVHKFTIASRPGDCGSPLITTSRPYKIVAMHAGGDGVQSAAFSISRDKIDQILKDKQVEIMSAELYESSPVLMEEIPTNYFGKELFQIKPIHERASVNYSKPNEAGHFGNFDAVCGTDYPVAKPHSKVNESPMSILGCFG